MEKQAEIKHPSFIGVIDKVEPVPAREGKSKWYKIYFGETIFSGFGECPAEEGDQIEFEYLENGPYKNIKKIIDIKSTHEKPSSKEFTQANELVRQEFKINPILLENDYLNRNVMLMKAAVDLSMKSGQFTMEEINAKYKRLTEATGNRPLHTPTTERQQQTTVTAEKK